MRDGFHDEDGSCLMCAGHAVQRLNAKTQRPFYGCSNYPKCRNTAAITSWHSGEFLLSDEDIAEAFYEAFYDGDGR